MKYDNLSPQNKITLWISKILNNTSNDNQTNDDEISLNNKLFELIFKRLN
jgi:hypothetical protein